MSKKTIRMNIEEINNIPQNKPVVYKILDNQDKNIYTGISKRGNVRERLEDHLKGNIDSIPGATKVQIEQMPSIEDARKKEANIISRSKPKYNKQGK